MVAIDPHCFIPTLVFFRSPLNPSERIQPIDNKENIACAHVCCNIPDYRYDTVVGVILLGIDRS